MRPRHSLLALLVLCTSASVTATGCAPSRPNPKLTKVVETLPDGPGAEATFTYDDDGHVTAAEISNSAFALTWQLSWSDDLLTEVEQATQFNGQPGIPSSVELVWDGGRLVEARTPNNGTTAIEYNDGGQVAAFDTTGGPIDERLTFEYDDAGRLAKLDGDANDTELEWSDRGLTGLRTTIAGNAVTVTTELDDQDRLAKMTSTFGSGTSTLSYSYGEDGNLERVDAVRVEGDAEGDSSTIELSYGEGDAVGLDVAPSFMAPFPGLFDLRGGGWTTVDTTTVLPKLLFPSW